MSLPLQLKYVTTASRMYYVEVSWLRTLWNCCGLVSVHETTVIWSLHCCIAIVIHLTYSWLTVGPLNVPMVSYSTLFMVNFTSDHTYVAWNACSELVNSVYCCGRSIILVPWVSDVLRLWSKDFDVLVQWKVARSDHSWYSGTQLVEPWYLRRV